jgi:hypothetical protein
LILIGRGAFHLLRRLSVSSDNSPFGIQSACYRMGPDATQKLIGYFERSLEGVQNKKKK